MDCGDNMSEIKDMLLKTYLKTGARPTSSVAKEVKEPEKTPPKPIPVERPKTLGDITLSMAAQRIYSPNLPPAPKSPPAKMMDQGTSSALGMEGPWGKPEDK